MTSRAVHHDIFGCVARGPQWDVLRVGVKHKRLNLEEVGDSIIVHTETTGDWVLRGENVKVVGVLAAFRLVSVENNSVISKVMYSTSRTDVQTGAFYASKTCLVCKKYEYRRWPFILIWSSDIPLFLKRRK